MKKVYIKYIITLVFGTIISFSIFFYKDLFVQNSIKDITLILSDSFLLPGVLITGAGILIMVSNGGMFDIFTFSIGKIRTFIFEGSEKSSQIGTYYDYKQRRERASCGFLVIVGSIFFVLSVIFNIIFYFV